MFIIIFFNQLFVTKHATAKVIIYYLIENNLIIVAPELEEICICEDVPSAPMVSHTYNDAMYRSYQSKGLDSTLKIKRICKIIPEPVPQNIMQERVPDRQVRTVNCPQYFRACPAVAYRTQAMGINPVSPRPLPPYMNVRPQVKFSTFF